MKKLIFFAYDLNIGGIETALVNLLNRLDYNKYVVTLVLEKKDGPLLSTLNPNVIVKEYKLNHSKNRIYRKLYNFFKRTIWFLFHKNKYDFSCCYATYSLMGAKLSKIASHNSSIYIHSDYTYIYKENKEFIDFFKKRQFKQFRTMFFVSNESKGHFIEKMGYSHKNMIVVNNFIDENKILELSKESINIQKNCDILFVFVGRLEEQSKCITKLLTLIRHLKKEFSIELWIIGDGPDKDIYKNYIKRNHLENSIKMLGLQENPYPYMKQADYIILTSNYEGFPVIYLESILLKKKLITTLNLSDECISISNKFGYLISSDVKMMKEQVKNLLLNDNLKLEDFDFEEHNQRKMKILESIFDEVV